MATFIDAANNEEVVGWDEIRTREIWYIHGTISEPNRWNDYPDSVNVCNIIAMAPKSEQDIKEMKKHEWIKKYCNFSFSWFGEKRTMEGMYNGLDNTVLERRRTSDKLVKELLSRKGKVDEIVFVAHSHGANVVLQAADRLTALFKHIFILSIATPAQNKKEIDSKFPLLGLTQTMKVFTANGDLYFYVNPENPDNIKNWDKITHIALWNKKDSVDECAFSLDLLKALIGAESGMTLNSDYFTSMHTKNIDFNVKNDFKSADRESKIMCGWRYQLKLLSHTLYDYVVNDYDLNGVHLPILRTYEQYAASIDTPYTQHERECLEIRTPSFTLPGKTPQWAGDKLRANNLEYLFTSINQYGYFLRSIDSMTKCSPNSFFSLKKYANPLGIYTELNPAITNRYYFFKEIATMSAAIEQQINYNRNIHNAGGKYWIDRRFITHGFDLAHPEAIQEAITKGRIRPFERVRRIETRQ